MTLGLCFSAANSISVNGSLAASRLLVFSKPLAFLSGSCLVSFRLRTDDSWPAEANCLFDAVALICFSYCCSGALLTVACFLKASGLLEGIWLQVLAPLRG